AQSRFRERWLDFGSNRFAVAATILAGLSVGSTVAAAVLLAVDIDPRWRILAVAFTAFFSLLTWAFKNRQAFETESRELADTEGLIATLDNVLAQLPDAAAANPDEATAKLYVEK